jgi:hypothetical protein
MPRPLRCSTRGGVVNHLKGFCVVGARAAQHQVDAGFGALKGKAGVFQFLDLLKHCALLLAREPLQAKLAPFDGDVVLAAQFAHQDTRLVAHQRGVHMLVAHHILDHGVDVRAALVGKGALAPTKGWWLSGLRLASSLT